MTARHSAIYDGTIAHRRRVGRGHGFRHRITLAYVDLEEVAGLRGGRLARRRPGLLRFRREDYLHETAVRDLVQQRTGTRPDGPIGVLTSLRTLGRCFNPVSFYWCFDAAGEHVEAVVAEVTNTPWGERHAYVLSDEPTPKALHVSPFFGMDQRYEWSAGVPGEALVVRIANREGTRRVFGATLAVRRRAMTRATRLHHAFSSLRVGVLIYAHALALKLQRVPVHRHP
jgi:DUF1365 family protein